jgi:integrase
VANSVVQTGQDDIQFLFRRLNRKEKNKVYRLGNERFLTFLRDTGYGLIDGLKEYVSKLNATTRSVQTYNTYLAGIKKRIREVIDLYEKQLPADAIYELERELRKLKQKKLNEDVVAVTPEDILSYDEIDVLIAECTDPFVALVMEFLSQTGVRIFESLNIKLEDIISTNKKKNLATIRIIGKGGKERTIYTALDLVTKIKGFFSGETYLFEHNGKKYNPTATTIRIQTWGYKVLGKKISAHTFRHSYATEQLKTQPTKAVSIMLGHSSTAITEMIYNHNIPDPEDYLIR